jgi:hypothetical protein
MNPNQFVQIDRVVFDVCHFGYFFIGKPSKKTMNCSNELFMELK